MKKQLLMLAVAISTIATAGLIALPLTTANALQEGDTVSFLVLQGEITPADYQGIDERIVFIGDPTIILIDASGCESGLHPVQDAVIISPGLGAKRIEVVVVTQTSPIAEGTEIHGIFEHPSSPCTTSVGDTYERFNAEVSRTR